MSSTIATSYKRVVVNNLIPAFGIYEMHTKNTKAKEWATYNKRVLQACLRDEGAVDVPKLEDWIRWMMDSFKIIFEGSTPSKYGDFVQQNVHYLDNLRLLRLCRRTHAPEN